MSASERIKREIKNMSKIIKIRIKNIDAFRKYQVINAQKNALDLTLKDLAIQAGLPTSKQFKKDCAGYLVDGNNNTVAKFTVFSKEAFMMPACKVCRIS